MPHWAKVTKPLKKAKVHYVMGSKTKGPPPELSRGAYFDSNVSILARVYDQDRDRIVDRGNNLGVCGMLCWHPDFEKTEELVVFCSTKPSVCYFMLGVYPDNISRTNKTQQDAWHLKVDEYSREPGCLAIYSGVNYSRETQSHFAQESMLRCLYQHAKTLSVPLVLFVESKETHDLQKQKANLERVIEIVTEEGWCPDTVSPKTTRSIPIVIQEALSTCRCDPDLMRLLVDAGLYLSVSLNDEFTGVDVVTPAADGHSETCSEASLQQCLRIIPSDRLLLSSCSPVHTPQNIPDEHIRGSKNEPSNFDYIVRSIAVRLGVSEAELSQQNLANSLSVYGLSQSGTAPSARKPGDRLYQGADGAWTHRGSRSGSAGDVAEKSDGGTDVPQTVLSLAHINLDGADDICDTVSAQQYLCAKCHNILWDQSHLVHSHTSGSNTVATGVDTAQQHCNGVYFLPVTLLGCCRGCYADSLVADAKSNVSCSHCSSKLGKQIPLPEDNTASVIVCSCPCGYEILSETATGTGGLMRITSTKVKPAAADADAVPTEVMCSDEAYGGGGGGRTLHSQVKGRDKSRSNTMEEEAPESGAKGTKKGKHGKKK
jgi:Tat protein secretion system quality control protein TatD with DNase activity